jgi:2-polyprenyl-3-methyl-5-hydroxy-6-metoxy-1,4-benzoquinol methylase
MASQHLFQTVYRGRQNFLHHMAYMRMAKVLLTLQILEKAGLSLEGKSIFDYGFGAGTFFRYCPASARIFGVEMDAVNVSEVQDMLVRRGHKNACLSAIDPDSWEKHPLLQRQYDFFLCSHVLEHLADPPKFLRRIVPCLNESGVFVGLVPINERRTNPHHVRVVQREAIMTWLRESGLNLRCYLECDPWSYWVQPLFTYDSGREHKLMHRLSQVVSLALGVPATLLGYRLWKSLSPSFAWCTRSQATQAAFIAVRADSSTA